MASIQLPEYIYTGIDSINNIFDREYKSILVISDSSCEKCGDFLERFKEKAEKNNIKADFLVNDDIVRLRESVGELLLQNIPEIIIAAGDGRISDCAMEISSVSDIPYCTVVSCAPTALIESDSADALLLRRVPQFSVLDPFFITRCDSGKIAYEGLGMLCLCAESYMSASDRYVKALSKKAFHQIYINIFSSYKGEISARENLLEGMYWAYIAFVNSHSFSWESVCYRLYESFKEEGVNALSLLAVSLVQITKSVYSDCPRELENLFHGLGIKNNDEAIKELRRLRAVMSVPGCIKNLSVSESAFLLLTDGLSKEDKETFCECFYGD